MTIPVDKLQDVRTIVTHADCPDGIASALILRDVLPEAEIVFGRYGTPELARLEAKPGMLFCDFSPPAERAQEFVDAGTIVLDHHRTAEAVVRAFGDLGIYADQAGVSGAVLAFNEVWKPLAYQGTQRPSNHEYEGRAAATIERFATIAGIRDTWQRNSELWRESCEQAEALRFWPWVRWPRSDWGLHGEFRNMLMIGEVLFEKNAERSKRMIAEGHGHETTTKLRVLIVSGKETSDLPDLVPEAELVVGFSYLAASDGTLRLNLSTRSRGDFDCGAFCKNFGGGGHRGAAGCTIPVLTNDANPYTFIADLVDRYETMRTRPF